MEKLGARHLFYKVLRYSWYFQISKVLSRSAIIRQLVYTLSISNKSTSWWKEHFVKHQLVSKYYEKDCRSGLKWSTEFMRLQFGRANEFWWWHFFWVMKIYLKSMKQRKKWEKNQLTSFSAWILEIRLILILKVFHNNKLEVCRRFFAY